MKKTLLQSALSHKPKRNNGGKDITDEHIELCLAWASGDISISQAQMALYGKNGGMNCYIDFARGLRKAITRGILVEKKKINQ